MAKKDWKTQAPAAAPAPVKPQVLHKLPDDVAAKYKYTGQGGVEVTSVKFGRITVDWSRITLKQAEFLISKGYPHLKKK